MMQVKMDLISLEHVYKINNVYKIVLF